MKKRDGGTHGAQVLGAHVEGPFINPEKKGAHDAAVLEEPLEVWSKQFSEFGSMPF